LKSHFAQNLQRGQLASKEIFKTLAVQQMKIRSNDSFQNHLKYFQLAFLSANNAAFLIKIFENSD